jgi:hypothetical protein
VAGSLQKTVQKTCTSHTASLKVWTHLAAIEQQLNAKKQVGLRRPVRMLLPRSGSNFGGSPLARSTKINKVVFLNSGPDLWMIAGNPVTTTALLYHVQYPSTLLGMASTL